MAKTFGLVAVRKAQSMFPSLVMAVVAALAAKFISEHYGAHVMLMALLIGMAFNFLTKDNGKYVAGIEFLAKALPVPVPVPVSVLSCLGWGSPFSRSRQQGMRCCISPYLA